MKTVKKFFVLVAIAIAILVVGVAGLTAFAVTKTTSHTTEKITICQTDGTHCTTTTKTYNK